MPEPAPRRTFRAFPLSDTCSELSSIPKPAGNFCLICFSPDSEVEGDLEITHRRHGAASTG